VATPRVTLRDVAERAGVSRTTGELVRGSLATAVRNEHLMFIGETEGDTEVEQRVVQDMLDRGVRGFLYGSMYTRRATLPAILRGHPVVLLNCVTRGRSHAMVVPDERRAGRAAATALLAAGHRDGIVVVGEVPGHVIAAQERDEGIRGALRDAGAAPAGAVDCLWWPEPARTAVAAFLREGGCATAFIAINDRVALGIYQALTNAGRRVPDDVSVVSFDDSDLASWLDPALTSVAIPHFELGRRAVELLLDDDRPTGVHRVPMPLRARASIGPPRR
jgi:LacI family transcriptional regulator